MERHRLARGVIAGALAVLALSGSTGVAGADPEIGPAAPTNNQTPTPIPGRTSDLPDRGGPTVDWGGTGMYCQNQTIRCRS
jgi:hypothetical protein